MIQRSWFVYFFAITGSILLSTWLNFHEMVINPDAICYLYSAEEVARSGLQSAMTLCPQAGWPFYSTLIYSFVNLTHFSYTFSAFFLDAIFSVISVVFFIAIVNKLYRHSRASENLKNAINPAILWLAALVILLAHNFNILRQDIIRDHGFWAFYVVSFYFLLDFFERRKWVSALVWSLSLLVATAFRVEGLFFLIGLPFLIFFSNDFQKRFRLFFLLNLPFLIIIGVGITWLFLHPSHTSSQLGRLPEVGRQVLHGLTKVIKQYETIETAISKNILTHVSLRDASLVTLLLLISWYLVNVIKSLSWGYFLLVLYAWTTKAASFTRSNKLVLSGYIIINLIVTFAFFAVNNFLSKRYLVALSLVLMLWVPFALEKLFYSPNNKKRGLAWVMSLFVFISALGGIFPFGHSKNYIRTAGDWLALNIPQQASLYSNDYQLMYYSKHFGREIFHKLREYNDVNVIAQGRWKQYDYLALLMNNDDRTRFVMQEIHLVPMQVFVSRHGDHIYIYKIPPQERQS